MAVKLPESFVRFIKKWPLSSEQAVKRLLEGDLEFGARQYAEKGTRHGTDGRWWRVWQEIQHIRGKSLEEALDDLSSEQRLLFALWAFEHNRAADGVIAYRRYLEKPGRIIPSARPNAIYLDHLLEAGRYEEVLSTVDALADPYDDVPLEQMRAVRAVVALGDTDAALARLAAVRDRHYDDGDIWALTAILHAQLGDQEQAQNALIECARWGVYDESLTQELLTALELTYDQWKSLRKTLQASLQEPESNYEEVVRQWFADPGARLKPTSSPSPHWFGGDEFHMPACQGCGHPIRQWFVLDIREIEPLRERLPSWTLFPLLGCVDCMVRMGQHDYEVDLDTLTVRLVNVAISLTPYGEPDDTFPVIPRQFARLEWVPPKTEPLEEDDFEKYGDWEHPQVAGTPAWVQDSLRVYCKTCRQGMVFVAAMTTASEFDYVPINNESGLQYHFACDACHTISVIAQWT